MDHIVLGAGIPFVIGGVVYFARGRRTGLVALLLMPVLMAAGALWALAPDIPRVLGFMNLYRRLDADPRCDVFLFHHSIDKVETDSPVYPVLFVFMLLCMLFVAWTELRKVEAD
ncbi:MAG: hypothetical protein WCN95_08300 [bacterium]